MKRRDFCKMIGVTAAAGLLPGRAEAQAAPDESGCRVLRSNLLIDRGMLDYVTASPDWDENGYVRSEIRNHVASLVTFLADEHPWCPRRLRIGSCVDAWESRAWEVVFDLHIARDEPLPRQGLFPIEYDETYPYTSRAIAALYEKQTRCYEVSFWDDTLVRDICRILNERPSILEFC